MNSNKWGAKSWTFFHVLAESIVDSESMVKITFEIIVKLCNILPCPECARHSQLYLRKININNLNTKHDLIRVLFEFHNHVNLQKKKPIFNIDGLAMYKPRNIIEAFNSFMTVYLTKGSFLLMADSFHRNMLIDGVKKWIIDNISRGGILLPK